MRLTIIVLLLLLALSPVHAQEQDKPMPDRWRGLILQESTSDDAIKTFGKPEKDNVGEFKPYPLEKRFDTKGKKFRHLLYKKLPGVKTAVLTFLDSKLVSIALELEKSIEAGALQNIYGVEFEPKFSGMSMALEPREFERDKGKLYAKNYPSVYHLISKTERSYVSAMVDNSSFKSLMLGSDRGSTGEGAFPGKTKWIQLISLSLENTAGADVLK
jgi:hypothetical protein